MSRPDILLLDELESHLDSGRRELLEAIVRSFDGAVVTVSHDRYLLDETATEIVELENGRTRVWPGNYSAYALARELEGKRQQQLYVTQQKEIARLEEATSGASSSGRTTPRTSVTRGRRGYSGVRSRAWTR